MRIKRIKRVSGERGWGDWFYFSINIGSGFGGPIFAVWHPHLSEPMLAFYRRWIPGDNEEEKSFTIYGDINLKKPYVYFWHCKPTAMSHSLDTIEDNILRIAKDVLGYEEDLIRLRQKGGNEND